LKGTNGPLTNYSAFTNPPPYCYKPENFVLLGHYAASIGNFLKTFRDNLSVPSSRVMILTLEDGPGRFSRNVDKKLSREYW